MSDVDINFDAVIETCQALRELVVKKPRHLADLRYMDRRQAAEYIGMSDHWLEKHASNPAAPRSFRYGRKVWYRRTDLDRWISQRENDPDQLENIWQIAENRKVAQPSDEDLDEAYREAWGEAPKAPPTLEAEDAFKRLFASLSPAQRELMASAVKPSTKKRK